MKISVDAGALCADKNNRFGNYVVTENLMKALLLYDHKNSYFFYTFCKKPNTRNLQPKIFWSTLRTSAEELINKKDYYFALNQALPLFTFSKIISFSHGLSFFYYPQLYPDSANKMKRQLTVMCQRSKLIIVPSEKIKKELVLINQLIETKIKVIAYGVPFDMLNNLKFKNSNLKFRERFFLTVGMDHPIKNHQIFPINKYKFVIATKVSRTKLKSLYQKATALVTTSLYESFNLPVLEALSQGCPVIGLKSAIIPEFEPYINLAKDKAELMLLFKKALAGRLKPVNDKEIREKFSWKNYVKKLTSFL